MEAIDEPPRQTPTRLTLEEVKGHFEHWRKTRTRQGKIPSSLWAEVKILMDRYPVNRIAQSLRITSAQIATNVDSDNKKFTFVPLLPEPPVACDREPDVRETCSIEIERPGGALLRVGNLPVACLLQILAQFAG